MESIGEKLRLAREEQDISIDKAARETFIARRYIVAMEEEDFDSFPGEPYLLGFLRNYSRYLGIDPDDITSLYKNTKIQEQPAPLEELIAKRGPNPVAIIVPIILVLSAAAGGYYYFFQNQGLADSEPREIVVEEPKPTGNVYNLKDEILEQVFSAGDIISVEVNQEDVVVEISKINTDSVVLSASTGELVLEKGQEMLADVIGDGKADLKIVLRAVEGEGDSAQTVLRFDRVVDSPNMSGILNVATEVERSTDTAVSEAVGATLEESRKRQTEIILQADRIEDISLEVNFRGLCLFRSRIDNRPLDERYFQRGDVFRDSMKESAQIWLANSGVASVRIGGQDLDLGNPGEVGVHLIRWVLDDASSKFNLELVPVY